MENKSIDVMKERTRQHKNFTTLLETGPFATNRSPTKKGFYNTAFEWIKEKDDNGERKFDSLTRSKFIAERDQIFQLLNVKEFSEIQKIIQDKNLREGTSKRVYSLLGKTYGIEGDEREIISKINSYAHNADSVINYLKDGTHPLSNFNTELEMLNEVSTTDNPVDLMLMIFDESFADKARFEAKRKLVLMNLAASIDQREKEVQNKNKFKKFDDFISEYVLTKEVKKGETETSYILSNHDPETFVCTSSQILSEKVQLQPGQKLTEVRRRRFEINGESIPIKIETREKSIEAKMIKDIRKGEENTALAVDDDLGFLGVLESISDVKKFENRLRQASTEYGSSMSLEEISDTLKGGKYDATNTGSSSEVKMKKFFAKMGGMRVDFILHTVKTYLDYLYQRGVAHDEYEAKRLFDSGTIDLLFPKSVYGISWEERKPEIFKQIRERLEK